MYGCQTVNMHESLPHLDDQCYQGQAAVAGAAMLLVSRSCTPVAAIGPPDAVGRHAPDQMEQLQRQEQPTAHRPWKKGLFTNMEPTSHAR